MKDRHKVLFALRRQSPEGPLEWWPVRAQTVNLQGATGLKLFSYRSGPLVFIVEHWSGVTVAYGPSLTYARREATRVVAEKTVNGLKQECYAMLRKLKPGKKPRVIKDEQPN